MLWIAVGMFWILGTLRPRQFRLRFGWVDAAVLGAIALHTCAAIWAIGHASPRPALNALWVWVGYGLSFVLLRQLVDSQREFARCWW